MRKFKCQNKPFSITYEQFNIVKIKRNFKKRKPPDKSSGFFEMHLFKSKYF